MAAPASGMQGLSKAEYLKRYLDTGSLADGPVKKKKKKKRPEGKGMRIVDDDAEDWKKGPVKKDEPVEEEEDQPVVAEFVDERPEEIKRMEEFRNTNKWKVIKGDDSPEDEGSHEQNSRATEDVSANAGNTGLSSPASPDSSPPRKARHDSPDPSPPQRARYDSPDPSPARRARHDSPDHSPHPKRQPSPSRKSRRDSPDASPPRRGRRDSPDASPPRRGRRDSPDASPPRRGRQDSPDTSPPRRGRQDSPDTSPPRRGRRDSPDTSPPRRGRQDSPDASPPRRGRRDSPLRRTKWDSPDASSVKKGRQDSPNASPPRRGRQDNPHRRTRWDSPDASLPTQTRQDSPTLSPSRKARKLSPQRKKHLNPTKTHKSFYTDSSQKNKNTSSDFLKKEKREPSMESYAKESKHNTKKSQSSSHSSLRHDSDSDLSPPRNRAVSPPQDSRKKAIRQKDSHMSPRRGTQHNGSDSDLSPPRQVQRRDSDSDLSPPRRRVESEKRSKGSQMLSGGRSGLVSAKVLREEKEEQRRGEKSNKNLEVESSNTETVFRDKSGKRRDLNSEREEQLKKKAQQEKKDEIYAKWGKGLVQQEQQRQNVEDAAREMAKPLARYIDDEDLDRMLREQEREGDPMAKFLKKKIDKESKGKKERPKYKGPNPPINRFNIWPGYRWDGVDRSNGFENQYFARMSEKKATQESAYKWSVEDM
ncbi:BUD13 homolog [Hyla sarda]|uniref:BUD13 homolog n=1 Tax=Hyla sarda TaxID=327740 RepID=UPI0024C43A9A|nr:BUD13 homolog [Hyla sarda]